MRNTQSKEDYVAKIGIKPIALLLVLLVLIISTACSSPQQVTPTPTTEPKVRKAALVDQIALTNPDPEFTDQALA